MVKREWPFADSSMFRHDVIYADPPWRFELYNEQTGGEKSPQGQYACMDLDWIKSLPVGHLANKNCVLFMWATFPMLPQAFEVIKAWGFDYKTGFAWAKESKKSREKQQKGKKDITWAFGNGYILRANSELLLIATTGQVEWLSKSVRNLIVAPQREHSRKPDEVYDIINDLLKPKDPIELFARNSLDGWTSWGNQVGKFGEANV